MNARSKVGRRRRGVTLIEILVASLIVSVCVASLTSLWSFSYTLTTRTYDQDAAYALARNTLEAIKQTGFTYTAEAPTNAPVVHYYKADMTPTDNNTAAARYKVSASVVSDLIVSGSNPVQPANNALRTVTVTVALYPGGQTIYQSGTYLVRAGI
jgi:prepilin-type N-terminal cleavage/methylation domain-containing protein